MKKQIIFLLLFILTATGRLYGQEYTSGLKQIQSTIDTLLADGFRRFPQEKVYLHLNQGLYLNGDTIWFKAYATAYGVPSRLSRILYTQLTDSTGRIINNSKFYLKQGVAAGAVPLLLNLTTGWYNLKAYTAWMLNFKGYSLFNLRIYIANTGLPGMEPGKSNAKKTYHIHFYPEGGNLVEGHLCNMAFKATDETGEPASVIGKLYNKTRDSVGTIHTVHDGMGEIQFEPEPGEVYMANIIFPDGSTQIIALPPAKKQPISLRIDPLPPAYIRLKMTFSGSNREREIIISAVQNNGTSVSYPCRLSRGTNIFDIDKGNFLNGIVRVTVFNVQGVPQTERICFVNKPDDATHILLTNDSSSDKPGVQNNFIIGLTDQTGKRLTGSFSASVTKLEFSADSFENISSYLLLSSELKGYVYRPAYYFCNNSDSLQRQLDLVMLTSGWRHFKASGIGPVKLKYAVETSQNITGRVVNYIPGKIKRVNLTLAAADSSVSFYKVQPDSAGRFFIADYKKPGEIKIYADAIEKKAVKPVKITLDQSIINQADVSLPDSAVIINTTGIPFIPPGYTNYATGLLSANNAIALKAIIIKDKLTSQLRQVIDDHVRRLTADQAYDLDILDTESLPTLNIIDYLPGRIPGLEVYRTNGGVVFHYRGVSSLLAAEEPPTVYIDEVRTDVEDLTDINLMEVALIRFLPPPVWFAPLNGSVNGVLMVYTKNAKDIKKSKPTTSVPPGKYVFSSFAVTREFDMPDYNRPLPKNKPDKRTTLFWQPDLKTDNQGKATIKFINPVTPGSIRLSIQGITETGIPVHFEKTF